MPAVTALRAVVGGRVQGVGFRYSVVDRADRLDLTGWVRNRRDGTVEVFAQGPGPALDELRRFLERGPAGARVTSALIEDAQPDASLTAFGILPTL
jgi:acylphosphatase